MKRLALQRSGFSVVELTLALGVAAVCLMAVFALLPIGLASNHAATQQTLAVNVLSGIAADLRNTPKSATTSPQFNIPIAGSTSPIFVDDMGRLSGTSKRFRVTVTSAGTPDNTARWLRANVSWPAEASTPVGSVDAFIAWDPK